MSKENTLNMENIVEYLSSLSVRDASKLSKLLQEEWGVSAAVAAAPAAAGTAAAPVEASEYELIIKSISDSGKIAIVRHVKTLLGDGASLMDAKKAIEGLPKPFKSGLEKSEADKMKEEFEKLGAEIELKAL